VLPHYSIAAAELSEAEKGGKKGYMKRRGDRREKKGGKKGEDSALAFCSWVFFIRTTTPGRAKE